MINKEILKDNRIMLPIEYNDGSCEEVIDTKLKDYEDLLTEYNIDDNIVKLVGIFRDNLKGMYKEYYLGHQSKAYSAFKSALLRQTADIGIFCSSLPKELFYRARKNEGNQDYENEEMFHIKYSKRGKVQTQRFSFPGLPCLYLGCSSYVCWMELDRPPFEQFQVATIRQKDTSKEFKMIDLCLHPLSVYAEMLDSQGTREEQENNIKKYLQWWPIMAACSIAVKNENDPFKPEYIFPQFMLQYLLEETTIEQYIGIKYMSIKVGKVSKKQYESNYRTYTNYVIPIRSSDQTKDGFCTTLDNEFEIVRNYSGRELQVLVDSIRESGVEHVSSDEKGQEDSLDDIKLYGTNDMPYLYSKSIFCRIETVLESETLDKYNDKGNMIIKPPTWEVYYN